MIILTVVAVCLFIGLLFEVIKLSVRVAWGLAKLAAFALCVIASPLLILFVISAGGLLLLLPVLMVVGACVILAKSI